MARIRNIKPDFFLDSYLCELSFAHRLFFAGLWCCADKEGRLVYEPKKLKVQILPYDNVNPEKILDDLAKKPFIHIYEVDGVKYIQIVNWHKHQKTHHSERESTYPVFNGENPLNNGEKALGKEYGILNTESGILNTEYGDGIRKIQEQGKKQKYQDFVLLTIDQHSKLVEKLGADLTDKYISRLNNYLGSKGKSYKSHYHTILSWVDKDKNERSNQLGQRNTGIPSEDRRKALEALTECAE